ncbi:hypothetical protein [Frondihabitans sp. VKM Ac-2883]|uniref:hypothetical protein n=1 Tax=Frondihabitans sp. VKM Ac-2883 TaxID=2783823 RepID=UPI00188CC884|nr:hypothetical protein [Frondihabitans sp. VKM Ac-2883]MBF4574691.1 hypothetical protein [Frondihabitans sp. VKM Ac-2883]
MSEEQAPPFLTGVPEEWLFDSNDELVENAFIAGMAWQEHQDQAALASERAKRDEAETLLDNVIRARNKYEVALEQAESTIDEQAEQIASLTKDLEVARARTRGAVSDYEEQYRRADAAKEAQK